MTWTLKETINTTSIERKTIYLAPQNSIVVDIAFVFNRKPFDWSGSDDDFELNELVISCKSKKQATSYKATSRFLYSVYCRVDDKKIKINAKDASVDLWLRLLDDWEERIPGSAAFFLPKSGIVNLELVFKYFDPKSAKIALNRYRQYDNFRDQLLLPAFCFELYSHYQKYTANLLTDTLSAPDRERTLQISNFLRDYITELYNLIPNENHHYQELSEMIEKFVADSTPIQEDLCAEVQHELLITGLTLAIRTKNWIHILKHFSQLSGLENKPLNDKLLAELKSLSPSDDIDVLTKFLCLLAEHVRNNSNEPANNKGKIPALSFFSP